MFGFVQHFNELKIKIFYILFSFLITFFTCYTHILYLINIISKPLMCKIDSDFIFTNIFEIFNTYLTLSFYLSFFLNIPIVIYYLYLFIKSGLFEFEKRFLLKLIFIFNTNLVLSVYLSYFFFLPLILYFLFNFDVVENFQFIILKMEPKIFDYVYSVCNFFILYGFFLFQIPTMFYLLVYFFNLNSDTFYKKRRFLIIFSLFIGCIFSSPDLLSLFLISFPLFIFFEFFIFVFILKKYYNKQHNIMRELLEW